MFNKNKHLSVVYKNGDVIISTTKSNGEYSTVPVLNGDEIYSAIDYLRDFEYDFDKKVDTYRKMPYYEWIKLSYNDEKTLKFKIKEESFKLENRILSIWPMSVAMLIFLLSW